MKGMVKVSYEKEKKFTQKEMNLGIATTIS
jgi:hypothetical protein